MDRAQACLVLGVDDDTPLKDAKKKYRDLVKIFHVDLLPEAERAAATDQLVRINLAWEVFQQPRPAQPTARTAHARGSSHRPGRQAETFQRAPRHPNSTECRLCGGMPAQQATFRAVRGVFLTISTTKEAGPFCRACGYAMFRSCQAHSWRGWWGISIVPAIYALVANRIAIRSFGTMRRAARRDPVVMTPFTMPLVEVRSTGSGTWLSPLAAGLLWFGVLFLVFGGGSTSTRGHGPPIELRSDHTFISAFDGLNDSSGPSAPRSGGPTDAFDRGDRS